MAEASLFLVGRSITVSDWSPRLKQQYILLSADGPHRNVLKFKPPMTFALADVDEVTAALDAILTELDLPSANGIAGNAKVNGVNGVNGVKVGAEENEVNANGGAAGLDAELIAPPIKKVKAC